MSGRFEFGPELGEVVDLPVEDHDDRAVLVEQGLLAGRDVDDRQAPMASSTWGSTCTDPSSGPRWICASLSRRISAASGVSARPGLRPTIPHMACPSAQSADDARAEPVDESPGHSAHVSIINRYFGLSGLFCGTPSRFSNRYS